MSVAMPSLSIKDLAVAISTRAELLRMTHRYINEGRNWSRLFVLTEWSSLLGEMI